MSPRTVFSATFTAACLIAANFTSACDHCGCAAPCQKTCRLVCETKKVEITCWGCKCEDFCIPGPSKPGCKHCEMVCEDCDAGCDPNGVHYQPHKFVWTEWIPGCAKIHTRKKLMKKTITKTIPSYKWVVENLCPQCVAHSQSAAVPVGTELPQLPADAAGARVMPVQHVAAAEATSSVVSDDESYDVQPATFELPLPAKGASTQSPPGNPAPAKSSWRDGFKLPWQR